MKYIDASKRDHGSRGKPAPQPQAAAKPEADKAPKKDGE